MFYCATRVGCDCEVSLHLVRKSEKMARNRSKNSWKKQKGKPVGGKKRNKHNIVKKNVKKVTDERDGDEQSTSAENRPSDVNEGRTLFLRNVPFHSTNETIKSAFEEFGDVEYALMVIDRETEYPKGTAFVKFKTKEGAEKSLLQSESTTFDGGITIDGQRVTVCLALSRNDVVEKSKLKDKRNKDKRNLSLMKEGIIKPSSKPFEEMSEYDKAMRQKLDLWKKDRIKDLKYFISRTRLCVWNIPPNIDGKKLRRIFVNAGGPGCNVTEARIMRDLQKKDASGEGVSKGFGFVNFTQHEHAMKALHKINHNPLIFTKEKRPVVEFSVENRMAEKAKLRRLDKSRKKLQHIKDNESSSSKSPKEKK